MKINVAILEQDQNYQNRLIVALREKFPENIEVFQCNAQNVASVIEAHEVKVLAIGQTVSADLSEVPERCAIVALTEERTEELVNDYMPVCKYQKASDIGKQLYYIGKNYDKILAEKKEQLRKAEEERLERERIEAEERRKKEEEERIEREKREKERIERERQEEEARQAAERERQEKERQRLLEEQRIREEKMKARRQNPALYVFIPATDGEGSSIASVAAAMVAPTDQMNILYLDFKQIGKMDRYFQTNSVGVGFDEILTDAINGSLTAEKLSSAISADNRLGVDYVYNNDCMYELGILGMEGFDNLMKAVGELEKYDAVVINLEGTLSPMSYGAIKRSEQVFFVAAGTPESNKYLENKLGAIKKYDKANETKLFDNVNILYNLFDRKSERVQGAKDAGTIPPLKGKNDAALFDLMIKQPPFVNMIKLPQD